MKVDNVNELKNKKHLISDRIIPSIMELGRRYSYKLFSEEQAGTLNKDGLEYWRNRTFSIISVLLVVFGTPLWLYGAYLFYTDGSAVYAAGEMLIPLIIWRIVTKQSLSISFRKYFIVFIIYFASILLLTTTGTKGAGMVCVVFSLILAGCLLNTRQAYGFVIFNMAVFTVMTLLYINGYFDNTSMSTFKSVWYINMITTQICGIILLLLINNVYKGLENQTRLLKKSGELLIASEIKHKAMIANISDIIVVVDRNGSIEYISPNVEQRYGWAVVDIMNKPIWERLLPEDINHIKGEFKTLSGRNGMEKIMHARCISEEGMVKYIELTAVNLLEDSDIRGILLNFHDITEHKIREEEISYLSYHDGLTGLYNRTYFEKEKERFDRIEKLPISIVIGDINGLKLINDSLGHVEGDKLMITIASILSDCFGKEDVLARIGGDEFGVLLPGKDGEAVLEMVKQINSIFEEYNKKVSSELNYTSISLGYATKTIKTESLDDIQKTAEDNMCKRKLLEGRSLHSALIASMKAALQEKSEETEAHAQRLVMLSRAVGQAVGLTDQQFDELELLATLHDIGKIGIDDHILNKPGKLTDEEWIEMKKHCEIGYRIAMSSPELIPIANYILTHHERWDGKGYPQGLEGEAIPLLSRIISVVDSYDAMTEDRSYRKGLSKEYAMKEIISNAGKQFDQEIAKIFIDIISNKVLEI